MKKIFTLFSLIITSLLINAQTPIYDSITMGPGYTNAVFYNLATGTKTNSPIFTNSDVQIRFEGRSASIRTVDGFGAKVYLPIVNATTDWATIDTTGMIEQSNSDTAWENGSFNTTATGHPNYGWGMYDNITHDINGSKIFVLKSATGTYKKIWILKLNSLTKTYYIRHANLDGSMDYTDTLSTTDFPNKNFGYFNFNTRAKYDAEPIGTQWDLVFRKYDRSPDAYPVTGALSNLNVLTAKVNSANPDSASGSGERYYTNMSVIGWDWKQFTPPTGPWEVVDTTAYFVLGQDNGIYRIVFTGFTGSSTGKAYFTKTKVGSLGVSNLNNQLSIATIYPNPFADNSVIAFTSKNSLSTQISIFDIHGKQVFIDQINTIEGLNIYELGKISLDAGMYFVNLNQNGETHTSRILVSK